MYQYTCTRMHVYFHRIFVYKHYRHYFIPNRGDPGFQNRGAHLKKLRRAEGVSKIFGVFRVKNHDFTGGKKSYFFQFQGGRAPGAPPPPGSAPAKYSRTSLAPTRMARIPWIAQTVSVFLDLPFPHRMINMRTTDLIGKTQRLQIYIVTLRIRVNNARMLTVTKIKFSSYIHVKIKCRI